MNWAGVLWAFGFVNLFGGVALAINGHGEGGAFAGGMATVWFIWGIIET